MGASSAAGYRRRPSLRPRFSLSDSCTVIPSEAAESPSRAKRAFSRALREAILECEFDETKPNDRGIRGSFHFMMRDLSIADLSPNPSPFRGGEPENWKARRINNQSQIKKQTHFMPDLQGFFSRALAR